MNLNNCPQCGNILISKKEGNYDRSYCQKCAEFTYINPVPVVAGVIKDEKNRILLIKRGVEPCIHHWTLPTGFIEINETPEESILREIKEETNLTCTIERLLGVYQQKGWKYESIIVLAYILNPIEGYPKAGDDAIDIKYFEYKTLPEIPFISHRKIIKNIYIEKT